MDHLAFKSLAYPCEKGLASTVGGSAGIFSAGREDAFVAEAGAFSQQAWIHSTLRLIGLPLYYRTFPGRDEYSGTFPVCGIYTVIPCAIGHRNHSVDGLAMAKEV